MLADVATEVMGQGGTLLRGFLEGFVLKIVLPLGGLALGIWLVRTWASRGGLR